MCQVLEWKSFTNIGTIRDIAIGGGRVWGVSNGGALQVIEGSSEPIKITNTEGLSSNDVVAVEIDQRGSVWFALSNGSLNRYLPEEDRWDNVSEYPNENEVITDLVAFRDSLYIGLDFGLRLFNINRSEVQETYKNFGFSPGNTVEKVAAKTIYIDGDEIWVATNRGIAKASLASSNLLPPTSWTKFTTANGLPTNFVNKVVVVDGVPYAATGSGVARMVNGVWEDTGFGSTEAASIDVVSANSFFSQNTVVVFSSAGAFYLNANQWQQLGESPTDVTAIKADAGGNVWVGRRDRGLATFEVSTANPAWVTYEANSPASNHFKALAIDGKSRLWCASLGGGVHMLDGEVWTNFSSTDGRLRSNDQRTVAIDGRDRVWFGSWGGGVSIFEEAGDDFNITQIDQRDGTLAGYSTDPNFVLINAISPDQSGNIWALNHDAINSRILVNFSEDLSPLYFSRNELGFVPLVTAIEIDRSGRVWIGSQTSGIRVLNHRNTLIDKSDDIVNQGLNVNVDRILSDNITAIIEDADGVMWIGTTEGVNYWFNEQVRVQFGIINSSINTIGVDPRNRKWFGTPSGISVLDNDGVIRTSYTTGNSPLVGSNVVSFAFNEETGDIWIGTTNGLSQVKSPFTRPSSTLDLLSGYPNPFRIDNAASRFTVTNLAVNTSVIIYNSAGHRVKSFSAQEEKIWDGRDDDGEFVASGVYVFLGYTDGGLSGTGKVAVIRR
jgi:ligand-binding sensor domain-containing protein